MCQSTLVNGAGEEKPRSPFPSTRDDRVPRDPHVTTKTATAVDKIRPLRSHTHRAPRAPGQAAALSGATCAPACISPSNRSDRSASVSVTERGKRPVLEKICWQTGENRAQGLTHFFALVAGPWCASEPCNGLRATVDRPRAVSGAIVRRVGAASARSRTCNNLLSLNRVYNYGMISVTCRRPFSELGDQQLLDQIKRLAANQRCLEVHILDHLDEIDRRGLALRRGFSSLFDYAVRELRFTDASAQRRIQTMRLCRRHGWVRASLQSGELSLTSAAQLETTFAGAERAERQSRTGRRNVGQGRCHDQDHDSAGGTRQLGLPAAPSEAGERGERGPRSTPELAPPAEQCAGDAAAMNTPVVPVASHAVAQDCGAGHAGALLPRPKLSGNASLFPVPSCAPDPVSPPRRHRTKAMLHNFCRRRISRRWRRRQRPCPRPFCRSRRHRSRCGPLRARRNRPAMIRLRSCRPARCRRLHCCIRSASAS